MLTTFFDYITNYFSNLFQEDIRQKGISFLLIDMHSEGIEVQPIDTLDNTPIGHHLSLIHI